METISFYPRIRSQSAEELIGLMTSIFDAEVEGADPGRPKSKLASAQETKEVGQEEIHRVFVGKFFFEVTDIESSLSDDRREVNLVGEEPRRDELVIQLQTDRESLDQIAQRIELYCYTRGVTIEVERGANFLAFKDFDGRVWKLLAGRTGH